MKKVVLGFLAIGILLATFGCSDSTSPTNEPNVNIVGELATRYVNISAMIKDNNQIQENEVDSIKIIRIRILLSAMKLFSDSSSTASEKIVKIEPFVYDVNETSALDTMLNTNVPSGLYEKIKFEIHRFSASETIQYSDDPVFMYFATSDRYSILIEGITYKNGNPSLFNFKAQTTANLSLKFEPSLNLKNNTYNNIFIQLDPNFFFKKWESLLDPADPKNANDIENSLVNTIKALKK